MDYSRIEKPVLRYAYEFAFDAINAAKACMDAHGFAIVKGVLPRERVEALKNAVVRVVDPGSKLKPGESRIHPSFIEAAAPMRDLLDFEPFMRVNRALMGTEQLTINRSAAILRKPGSAAVAWHTDWHGFSGEPPVDSGEVLNRGPWPSGKWFYLTGSWPEHGGLAVIEDSHVACWQGPEGFQMLPNRRSFYPAGEEPCAYSGFDVPGLVPIFADPGDMIVFAHRTYHAAFPNRTDNVRLSCALGFRPSDYKIKAPWPLPESAVAFKKSLPDRHRAYVEDYSGIDVDWRGGAGSKATGQSSMM